MKDTTQLLVDRLNQAENPEWWLAVLDTVLVDTENIKEAVELADEYVQDHPDPPDSELDIALKYVGEGVQGFKRKGFRKVRVKGSFLARRRNKGELGRSVPRGTPRFEEGPKQPEDLTPPEISEEVIPEEIPQAQAEIPEPVTLPASEVSQPAPESETPSEPATLWKKPRMEDFPGPNTAPLARRIYGEDAPVHGYFEMTNTLAWNSIGQWSDNIADEAGSNDLDIDPMYQTVDEFVGERVQSMEPEEHLRLLRHLSDYRADDEGLWQGERDPERILEIQAYYTLERAVMDGIQTVFDKIDKELESFEQGESESNETFSSFRSTWTWLYLELLGTGRWDEKLLPMVYAAIGDLIKDGDFSASLALTDQMEELNSWNRGFIQGARERINQWQSLVNQDKKNQEEQEALEERNAEYERRRGGEKSLKRVKDEILEREQEHPPVPEIPTESEFSREIDIPEQEEPPFIEAEEETLEPEKLEQEAPFPLSREEGPEKSEQETVSKPPVPQKTEAPRKPQAPDFSIPRIRDGIRNSLRGNITEYRELPAPQRHQVTAYLLTTEDGTKGVFKYPQGREDIEPVVEVLVGKVAEMLGFGDLIPPTEFRDWRGEYGSFQFYMSNFETAYEMAYPYGEDNPEIRKDLFRLACFNALSANSDVHPGQYGNLGGKVKGVDQGKCLDILRFWKGNIDLIYHFLDEQIPDEFFESVKKSYNRDAMEKLLSQPVYSRIPVVDKEGLLDRIEIFLNSYKQGRTLRGVMEEMSDKMRELAGGGFYR